VGGLGALALLYLLRLDRLLRGWAPHLAGLVTVVLMAARSDPWAWGLAAGLAMLGVGLARLPDWRLLVAGLAVSAVFGAGYGITHYRTASEQRADQASAARAQSTNVMATSPELLIMSLANSIAGADAPTVCALLGSPAREQFSVSVGAPDCASAVGSLAAQVVNPQAYRGTQLRAGAVVKHGDTATVDGCQATWAVAPSGLAPGPRLGRFELRRYQGGDRYLVVGYTPCR
jgi:F0F1-type ATP synthase membrane subunit c/vacuolar-type H+-ATPase subunit K